MSRCGCKSDCLCKMQNGSGTIVSGNGTIASPYVVQVVVDPVEGNLLSVSPTGLLVNLADRPIEVIDSDCFNFVGDGTTASPLTGSPIVDPAAGNALGCGPAGMLVSLPGKVLHRIVTTEIDYAAAVGDLVLANSAGATIDVALPPAAGAAGREITVKRVSTGNNVVLNPYSTQVIDGAATLTLTAQWDSATVVSSGTAWFRIGSA